MRKNENVYEPDAGENISQTAKVLCKLAAEKGFSVSANFNDITVTAEPGDKPAAVERAYLQESNRRHEEYAKSPECIASAKRQEEARQRAAESAAEGIKPFDCIDTAIWDSWVTSNTDGYGACVVRYAARWANLMDAAIAGGSTVEAVADQMSHNADTEGITGFMYGCAVSMLAKAWKHGEELRQWHNLKTQIRDEGKRANETGGVLNPALLSLGEK